jgi:hypothetical protein
MKIAYKIGKLITAEAKNYYPTCKGRNLNCRLTIENKVIGHAKVDISPFTCNFKRMNQSLRAGNIFMYIKSKIEYIYTHIYFKPQYMNLGTALRASPDSPAV